MDLRTWEDQRGRVSTASGDVSYTDVGEGPVALFVHGVGTNNLLWRKVMTELAGERRCVAPDLPGHGASPVTPAQDLSLNGLARLLEDFCESLELGTVDLVANDTGGAVAQVFAAHHPDRVRTLTLTNCDTRGNLPPESFRPVVELAERGKLAPLLVQLAADPERARTAALGGGYEHPEQLSDEVLAAFVRPVGGTLEAAREFERLLTSVRGEELDAIEPLLKEFRVPTLLVWGTGDPNFGVEWAYRFRDAVPGVTEVVEVPGAKLFFPDERPEDLVPHLRRHWA
ncbi:hydrolase [Amycolatopsis mediterranei S699]|uniref:Hydrolase n=2 Tax=Amycolatopsis mediterranei TaxID=33910 RepID=A0A0H3D9G8_AMYMU|nr:alpha/beta hydrolase [Amycolatopsis mediterranei]ADJ46723.1 hydrolase [Amycolatopsis mediterranei U32]AEK43525.1 hydrolase [Amycolatopsis mediterranei S699]AFO78434.1 hydrolase [Amycolatopsis mediterranei S699]KDO11375.1 hydrolase [Amycolatopsis mediterranei]KDU90562.1 hydrolase [Amycolatopsis mediterranei]